MPEGKARAFRNATPSAKPGTRPGVLRDETESAKPGTRPGVLRDETESAKPGPFSTANFIRPEEQELFNEFTAGYMTDLCPESPLERTLAVEIIHAAWRLRRCAAIESSAPNDAGPKELDLIQASVDRARTTAQRTLHRSLAELRRVQTERVYRNIALPPGFNTENLGQASCIRIDPAAIVIKQASVADAIARNAIAQSYLEPASQSQPSSPGSACSPQRLRSAHDSAPANSAKQSQSSAQAAGAAVVRANQSRPQAAGAAVVRAEQSPPPVPPIPRNAPCPCGSRDKYKRCCGKGAPPVLSGKAA